jgi:hypothetical protein
MMRRLCLALLLTCTACGKIPDAADELDGGPITPDARLPGLAKVTLHARPGQAVEHASVIFTHPDGTVVLDGDQQTDASGSAQAVISPGDWIWVQDVGLTGEVKTYTITDCQPGDDLQLDERRLVSENPRPMTVILPPSGLPAGTTSQELHFGCGSQGANLGDTALTITVSDTCLNNGNYDLVLLATDTNGTLLGYSHLSTAYAATVTMPGWSSNFSRMNVQYIDPVLDDGGQPLSLTQLSWSQFIPPTKRSYFDGHRELAPSPTTTTTYADLRFVPGLPFNFVGLLGQFNDTGIGGRFVAVSSPSGTLDIDGGGFLPFVSDIAYPSLGGAFTWTEHVPGGGRGDLASLDLVNIIVRSSMGSSSSDWIISTRATTATSGFAPVVPASFMPNMPVVGSDRPPEAFFIDYDTVDGWDDVRSNMTLPADLENVLLPGETGMRVSVAGDLH